MKIRLREGVIYGHCTKAGISRDELARRMNVSSSTAWRIDTGRVAPSPLFIAALMKETGEKFEALFEVVEAAA